MVAYEFQHGKALRIEFPSPRQFSQLTRNLFIPVIEINQTPVIINN